MTDPLRIGVAGLGFGASIHVPGFRQIPGVEVVGICGRDQSKAADAAQRLGIPNATTSVEALLDLELDAISLALPPDANARGAALVVQRGVAVLCEKPLAIDPTTALELATAAAAAGLTNCVGFQYAELDAFRAAYSLVQSGSLGKLESLDVQWRTMGYAQRTGVWSWKRDRAHDGGVMTLLGTHLLYLLEWMCGPVATLSGESFVGSPGAGVPAGAAEAGNSAELAFVFAAGASGRASVSNAFTGAPLHEWTLAFDKGSITIRNDSADYMRGFRVQVTDSHGTRVEFEDTSSPAEDGRLAPFVRLASRFVSAVRAQEPVKPDFADAARVASLASLVQSRA